MDMRGRILAPGGEYISHEQRVELDAADVIRRLLLFDTYILNSTRLLEIPGLVDLFGLSGLMMLLDSGCMKIRCEAIAMGTMGETALGPNANKGIFPLKDILLVQSADRKKYFGDCLQNVHKARVNLKEAIQLKRKIVDSSLESPPDIGSASLDSARGDLKNTKLLAIIAAQSLRELAQIEVPPNAIIVKAHQLDSKSFEVESNITSLQGVDEFLAQKVLDNAFRAIGSLNLRIEEMRVFKAVSGFSDDDLAAFVNKLDFLVGTITESQEKEQAFTRVVEIAGVPDGPINGVIDVEKLLRIRESKGCIELREWLRSVNNLSDAEVRNMVSSFKAKTSSFIHSGPGKFIRLLVPTVTGLLPDLGLVGVALTGLDLFIAERLLPESGPTAFINRLYPSIFPEQINREQG